MCIAPRQQLRTYGNLLNISIQSKTLVPRSGSLGRFLDYKMVDSKIVVNQVQELQMIIHDSHSEGMVINESFQVAAVIEKLPHTWKEFKNYLKNKRKKMTMEDLILRLRIEEDNRGSERSHVASEEANMVEHG